MVKKGRGVRAVSVTHDSDGGCTVTDVRSGLRVSIIGTHPDANGPIGVTIEVYDYNGRDVLMEDATIMRHGRRDDEGDAPLRLVIAHHPTVAFYPDNRSVPRDPEEAVLDHFAEDEHESRSLGSNPVTR
jgi:hypothetical protein